MGTLVKIGITMGLLGMLRCEDHAGSAIHLAKIDASQYHQDEIIPPAYTRIYDKWKLVGISGGYTGAGYQPDFDFLEIKPMGIYGLVRNDSLFEHGKIELDTFDANRVEVLQIKLIPEFLSADAAMSPAEKYIEMIGTDSLSLVSPCCDRYDYHFKRVER